MNIKLKRYARTAQLVNAILRIEPAGHTDFEHFIAERTKVTDYVNVSGGAILKLDYAVLLDCDIGELRLEFEDSRLKQIDLFAVGHGELILECLDFVVIFCFFCFNFFLFFGESFTIFGFLAHLLSDCKLFLACLLFFDIVVIFYLYSVNYVKRIKAVKIEPTENGLTVIGGRNGQGKTSVLDSIAWALGGDRFRPSEPQREGSVLPPNLKITMDSGIIVERTGKNSTLKVTDPTGRKGGQQLINEFISQLALDLPRFTTASNKEKANTLLRIIGVGDRLAQLEHDETELYNKRHMIGQIADQKLKYAREMTEYPDVPEQLISASELIKQQQGIMAHNAENKRKRDRAAEIQHHYDAVNSKINGIQAELQRLMTEQQSLMDDLRIAHMETEHLEDLSTAELEEDIENVEKINIKIRANLEKEKAEEDAKAYQTQYSQLTNELEDVRQKKTDLLKSAQLPLPGLSVKDGELTYNGFKWDNMSGADQLKVSTAIVRKLNPSCGFVLLDKLEQMDLDTLAEFGKWLESEGLQAIATRVSTGDECSVLIEDGYVVNEPTETKKETKKAWKAGQF